MLFLLSIPHVPVDMGIGIRGSIMARPANASPRILHLQDSKRKFERVHKVVMK